MHLPRFPKFVTMPLESKEWDKEKFKKEIIRRVNEVKNEWVVVTYKGKNPPLLSFGKGLKPRDFGDKTVMSALAFQDWEERNPDWRSLEM
jgi:hypothetical protein